MKRQLLVLSIALAGGLASGLPARAFDLGKHFEVTITNLTRGQHSSRRSW